MHCRCDKRPEEFEQPFSLHPISSKLPYLLAMEENQQPNSSGEDLPDAKNGAASMLVGKVADLMTLGLNAGELLNNPPVLTELCLALAKGMDYALANNEVPIRSRDLPPLLKQVYSAPFDSSVRLGFMMLTMSIQVTESCNQIPCSESACNLEWFTNQDTDDLLILAKEAMRNFSDPDNIRFEPSYASHWASKVMSRFCPNMKIDEILLSVELKPGYRFCVGGFPIIMGRVAPEQENIFLLVAQLDKLQTSACIITPPDVSFLLNGQGVEGRTLGSTVTRPQLPTNVTGKLKYGVNCLQAIGQFEGNFLTVIAVMSKAQASNSRQLQDYVRPAGLTDSEAQNMEMPSRMSLKCPISKSRIKTPVKGKLCKHPQCFDYDSFLELNSMRPLWQCPLCEQPVCNEDICIDQNVAKVLREAKKKVVNVILSANGSWKEDRDHCAQTYEDRQASHQKEQHNLESSSRVTAARITPFPITSGTSSRPNSSAVVEEARIILNEELQPADAADWRPTSRMRGSLTGEAYAAALQQFMNQRALRAQAARSASIMVPTPSLPVSIRGPSTNAADDCSISQAENDQIPADSASNPSGR